MVTAEAGDQASGECEAGRRGSGGPAGEWASPGQAAPAGAGGEGALPSPRALGRASRPAGSPGDSRGSQEVLAGFRPKGKLRCVAMAGVPSAGSLGSRGGAATLCNLFLRPSLCLTLRAQGHPWGPSP